MVSNPPPPHCPPGQQHDGVACRPAPPPPPTATATTAPPTPPIPTVVSGPFATPLDATQAQAAAPVLDALAKAQVPAGAVPSAGGLVAGNFGPGQVLELALQMQPGRCYSVVGAGLPGVEELDIELAPPSPMAGVPAPVLAKDSATGPTAVVGAAPNCFKWAAPVAGPMRLILRVVRGQGVAAARVYEK